MATVLPFIQKDVFGGPSGSTQDAMKMLVQGILANSAKRRENRQNQMAQGIISGVGADNPNATGTDFVNALLSSNLRPETIKNWSNLYGTQSDINLNEAQAQNLRTPKASDKFGEPYKVGKKWLQRNLNTNRIQEAYSDPEGWSKPYVDTEGNYVQKNLDTEEIKIISKATDTEDYGEPVKKGNTWVQKNKKTGRYVKAYSDPEGWSKPYMDADGNKVQDNLDTGEQKVITKASTDSASQQISQLKLDAWKAYLNGRATKEQEAMIGTDSDPYLAPAANAVNNDIENIGLTDKEKIQKIIDLADLMRNSANQKNRGIPTIPVLPKGFILDQQ